MIEIGLFLAGAAIGGLIAWLLTSTATRARAAQAAAEIQKQLGSSEATLAEVRAQLTARDSAILALRTTLEAEQQTRITAETRFAEMLKNVQEQRDLLSHAESRLKDAFTALARDALKANTEDFALQAAQKVEPLREALTRYEAQIKQMEDARQTAYGGLTQQLTAVSAAHQQLSLQTSSLVTALRTPQVKGRWGEITLQRAVEVAGLSPYCDFSAQQSVATDDGKRRPDLVVKLPGGRTIVVDSKAPTAAFLDGIEAPDELARKDHLRRHAQAVRTHMQGLSSKAYWNQFQPAPDFVVLFLPGESFFSAALEQDRTLIEDGIESRVILATPTTLIALLRTVAHSWQQQQLVENARKIGETATLLFDRVRKFAEHLMKTGDGLRKATDAYNASIASWENRIAPMERRIVELGAMTADAEIPPFAPIDTAPRKLPASIIEGGP